MTPYMTDAELDEIEEALNAAERVIPPPWEALCETKAGVGGSSFVSGGDPERDHEIYLELNLDGGIVRSPNEQLDVVVEFVGRSGADIRRLLTEVRALRRPQGPPGT
jgi:hypothetical protein